MTLELKEQTLQLLVAISLFGEGLIFSHISSINIHIHHHCILCVEYIMTIIL